MSKMKEWVGDLLLDVFDYLLDEEHKYRQVIFAVVVDIIILINILPPILRFVIAVAG